MAIKVKETVVGDSRVDVTTREGHRVTTLDGLHRYNTETVDRTIAEAKEIRATRGDRAEKVIRDAIEGEGRSYIESRSRGRVRFFGGWTPPKKGQA